MSRKWNQSDSNWQHVLLLNEWRLIADVGATSMIGMQHNHRDHGV
jgi:hypothetical protein